MLTFIGLHLDSRIFNAIVNFALRTTNSFWKWGS